MAGYNGSSDYDFSRFRSKNSSVKYDPYSSAAVKLAPEPYYEDEQPKARPRQQRSGNTESKKAVRVRRFNIIKVLSVTVLIISMFSAVLACRIDNDEMITNISQAEARLKVAESENTRLRTVISSDSSYDKIEDLARNKLGMVQLDGSQVTYFETTNGDRVIVKKGK